MIQQHSCPILIYVQFKFNRDKLRKILQLNMQIIYCIFCLIFHLLVTTLYIKRAQRRIEKREGLKTAGTRWKHSSDFSCASYRIWRNPHVEVKHGPDCGTSVIPSPTNRQPSTRSCLTSCSPPRFPLISTQRALGG